MKKIIICLVICFGFILNHYSFADTGMYKFSLESFEIYRQTDQKIFGYFELDNKNEVHYPELKYILYLLPEDIKNDGGITFAADRSDPVIFSVNANETKLVAFEYDIPKDLPTNTYSLALSIYDNTSEIYAIQNKGGIKLGSSTEYIVSPNDDEMRIHEQVPVI